MGQINVKIAGHLSSPMDITEAVLSQYRAGDVFILVKGSSSLTKSKEEEESTNTESTTSHIYHYSVLVDLQGSRVMDIIHHLMEMIKRKKSINTKRKRNIDKKRKKNVQQKFLLKKKRKLLN
jgi:hypothetical protein